MHGDNATLLDDVVRQLDELADDLIRRVRPVIEIEVDVLDAAFLEQALVVQWVIEPHNHLDIPAFKVLEAILERLWQAARHTR